MLNIDVNIDNFEKLKINKGIDSITNNANKELLSIMRKDCEPFVPMKTGNLREKVNEVVSGDKAFLDYYASYAPHVYAMGAENTFTTPGTGGDWFNEAAKVNSFKWIVEYARIVKKLLGESGTDGWNV